MKVLINYGNKKFEKARNLNSWTGKHIAKFDKVYSFGPEDVPTEYRAAHEDVFSVKRGNGLWLWKSYLILKVMEECEDGDYIFYVDSGAFFIRNVDTIIASMKEGEKIWVSDCPLLESCFTKPACFELMDCTEERYKDSNQIQSGFFLAINCEETRAFVKEWNRYNEILDVVAPEGGLNLTEKRGNGFVAHREDQSILSLLCKKNGIRVHRDPSQRGKYPETFYNEKYAYRVPEHPEDHYKPFVFLHKSPSASIVHMIKLVIKSVIAVAKVRREGKSI